MMSLRKSYHEKQQNETARSLDFAVHRSASISGPTPHMYESLEGAALARRGSLSSASALSTSPTHSRGSSFASGSLDHSRGSSFASGSLEIPAAIARAQMAASSTLVDSSSLVETRQPNRPPEAIKLQRVPTAVRIAQSLHPLVAATAASTASLSVA